MAALEACGTRHFCFVLLLDLAHLKGRPDACFYLLRLVARDTTAEFKLFTSISGRSRLDGGVGDGAGGCGAVGTL